MGKKSSSKGQPPSSAPGREQPRHAQQGFGPFIWVGALVVAVAVGVVALRPRAEPAASGGPSSAPTVAGATEASVQAADLPAAPAQPDAETVARTVATAQLG